MQKKFLVIILLCGLGLTLSIATNDQINAQSSVSPLPADIVFSTGGDPKLSPYYSILARVDAETLVVTPFYVDEEALYVKAVSWSPDGNLLAFLRRLPNPGAKHLANELCLLNRGGVFQRCFEETPPPNLNMDSYTVMWSEDSQKAYFVSETITGDYTGIRRLIEADVTTGQTSRVIFEHPYDQTELFSHLAWSPDFNYLAFGVDYNVYERDGIVGTMLINLGTGEQLDLHSIVPAHTTLGYVCPHLSPLGIYLTVLADYYPQEYDPTSEIDPTRILHLTFIYNYQTGAQFIFGEPNGDVTIQVIDCPLWQPDEQSFSFLARGIQNKAEYIYRYSFTPQSLAVVYTAEPDDWGLVPIYRLEALSPDGAYIAFQSSDTVPEIGVLYPTGEIQKFGAPYQFSLYPVWVPTSLP